MHKGVSYPVGAIITQYRGDFGKHASANELPKINMVWDSIPMQLAKENRKFFFGKMKKGARSGDFEVAIQWLVDSGLLQIGMNAVPVEVKAETNVRSQSLKAFYDKFHPEKSIRFSLLPYKDQDWMVNMPLYSVCNL